MKYFIPLISIVIFSWLGADSYATMPGNTKIIFAKKVSVDRVNCYPVINGILRRCLDRGDSSSFCHTQYYSNEKVCGKLHAKPSSAKPSAISRYTACIRAAQCKNKTAGSARKWCYEDCRKKSGYSR